MYTSIPSSTVDTVARLIFCSSPTKWICKEIHLTVVFDLLASQAPGVAKYDQELIRQHLCDCLSKCLFSPFPAKGKRSVTDIKYKSTFEIKIFCICRLPEHSVKGVSAGSLPIFWTFQTAFLVRHASRGNAQLARTPAHCGKYSEEAQICVWYLPLEFSTYLLEKPFKLTRSH